MSFLSQYSAFLAKLLTVVLAVFTVIVGFFSAARRAKEQNKPKLCIRNLNKKYSEFVKLLNAEILSKKEQKRYRKAEKIKTKKNEQFSKKRTFVLNFHGDIKASAVENLREEITALILILNPTDEVVLRLESSGGMVAAYGLAASQLQRIKNKRIPLIVAIDKIAASGGYLMACVADKILAAPFAIVGSIGVVAQLPNFHRYLKKRDIDFELLTAGKYKRSLTLFGKNTKKDRRKMQSDLKKIHRVFKDFIEENRKNVDIHQVATGAHWLAKEAINYNLIDELMTSDDYLSHLASEGKTEIYEIEYLRKKTTLEKLTGNLQLLLHNLIFK